MILHCHIVPTCLLEFRGKATIGCEAGDPGVPLAAAVRVVLSARSPWGRLGFANDHKRGQVPALDLQRFGIVHCQVGSILNCHIRERPSGGGAPGPE
jgi:hypothetical protein